MIEKRSKFWSTARREWSNVGRELSNSGREELVFRHLVGIGLGKMGDRASSTLVGLI